MENNEGSKYVGNFDNNKLHGHGDMSYANGNRYVGNWKYDKPNGQGTYYWEKGDVYTGNFVEGVKQGKGSLKYADGSVIQGVWKNDILQTFIMESTGVEFSGNWTRSPRCNQKPSK